jgi:hypothetical protein
VAWLAYTIHGDELSGTDASMLVAYRLAAAEDERTRRLRDELVVHIDPLMNPDGRERYLAQLQALRGKVENPDYQAMQHSGLWSAGRTNHYLFDLNRDWLPQVHPETRGRARAILEWNPHLLIDAHEMGGLDTYLFDPPREPINRMQSDRLRTWRDVFSKEQAAAFDRFGWSYYTQEWYEEWYPGYTNAWASLLGTIGLLYEQAALNGASLKKPSGEIETYRDAVHHQYVSSIANLGTLLDNRQGIVADYHADRVWAVSAEGPHRETFLVPPSADWSRHEALAALLTRHGIEVAVAGEAFSAAGATDVWRARHDEVGLPAGTLVVRSEQPHRRLLHGICGFDPRMTDEFLQRERTELERRRGSLLYDVTGWSLPMAYGLEAYWADRVDDVATRAWEPSARRIRFIDPEAAYGYVIDGADKDVHRAVTRLMQRGCTVRVNSKPMTVAGAEYGRGSILVRKHENPDDLAAILDEVTDDLAVTVASADTALSKNGWDLGGRRMHLLHEPRVALAMQWPISSYSFGTIWHALDARLGLRVSPVNAQRLGRMDLRKYNVLILPSSFALSAVLDDGAARRLRQWVQDGGTLITVGGSTAWAADPGRSMSGARLRRDVLDALDEYEEAVRRETAARAVTVDSAHVWGDTAATDDAPEPDEAGDDGVGAPTGDALKRLDAWQRLFSPDGTFVKATLDEEHWLCFGLPAEMPVLVSGSRVYLTKPPTATPVRLAGADDLRLSGLLWPEARHRLERGAFVTVDRVGRGQVIAFAYDPVFRGYTEGTMRMLYNAVLLGPGMGTSQPVPW